MNKILSVALAAIVMLASCSKENGGANDTTGKVALSVKIDMSKFASKSGDASFTDIPEWDQLLLVVTDSDNAFVEEVVLTKAAFDLLPGGKVNLLDRSTNTKLVGGKVTAYITTKENDWGVLTAKTTPNLPVLAAGQLDINKWQPSGIITGAIAGKFVNVPYYGQSAAIAKIGVTAEGRELLEATVAVTPELGRIQVLKTPQTGGIPLNGTTTVTSLTVSNIYINKITSGGTVATPTVVDIRTENNDVNVDPATWKTNFYAASKPLAGMWDIITDNSTSKLTNKGYQIFDKNTPHVIVEVLYKLTETGKAEGAEKTGYLTITKFTYTEGTNDFTGADLIVNKGKIYNIDLSKLQPTFIQITEDPYDNTTYHDLVATVTVAPWTDIEVTPEL